MGQEIFNEKVCEGIASEYLKKQKERAKLPESERGLIEREEVILGRTLADMQARGYSRSIRSAFALLQRDIHERAVEKGWYDGRERQPLEFHMLFVTELAEASEAVRQNIPATCIEDGSGTFIECAPELMGDSIKGKPEGEMIELADAVIRILDYFEYKQISLADCIIAKHDYNNRRGYRHGGKSV